MSVHNINFVEKTFQSFISGAAYTQMAAEVTREYQLSLP